MKSAELGESDTRDTFKIVFYTCHDKPGVSITPSDKWYGNLYIYIYLTHLAAIQLIFVALFAVEKRSDPLATSPPFSFLPPVIHISLHTSIHGSICVYARIHRIAPGKSLYRW